jgi:2-methylcitrate dehydratase PrpD
VKGFHSFWHLPQNGYKAYPSGSLTHPAVDAVLDVRETHEFEPGEIERVHASVHQYAATVTGNPAPTTPTEARFSLPHCVAVALLKRRLLPADFATGVVNDAVVKELRSRIEVSVDPDVSKRGASVFVRLRDGRVLEHTVVANRGTPGNPMRDEDLSRKFLGGAVSVLGEAAARDLLARCWSMEDMDDISTLVKATAGAA